jgi:hypothetical protein
MQVRPPEAANGSPYPGDEPTGMHRSARRSLRFESNAGMVNVAAREELVETLSHVP